jgi:hypothetical protein
MVTLFCALETGSKEKRRKGKTLCGSVKTFIDLI